MEVWEYELVVPQHNTAGQELGKLALTVLTLGTAGFVIQIKRNSIGYIL